MKKTAWIMMTAGMFAATAAHADGFLCQGRSSGIKAELYNHTQPQMGTRRAAVLVLSNPAVQPPRQTIARFTDANGTLAYRGHGQYIAKVDLRFNDSGRKGENIGGTKLGELKSILLDLNFSYNSLDVQLANVNDVYGVIRYFKRDGEVLAESVVCSRYLKH